MSVTADVRKMKVIRLLLALFVALDVLVSCLYFSHQYDACRAETLGDELAECRSAAAGSVEDMSIALSTLAACFEADTGWTQTQSIRLMKALQLRRGFDFVVRTEADGTAFNMDGKTDIYLGDRPYFLAGMQGEATTSFISKGRVDTSSGFILSAVPVFLDGVPVGIVHGSYSVDHYFSNISGRAAAEEAYVLLLDADGKVAASLNDKNKGQSLADLGVSEADAAAVRAAVVSGRAASVPCRIDGAEALMSLVPTDFYEADLAFAVARKTVGIHVDGESFLRMSLPYLVGNGTLWCIWVMLLLYILGRRRAEQETRRLNAMLSNVPTGIVVYRVEDGDVSVAECSDTALRMLGLARSRVLGAKNEALLGPVHEEDRPLARQMIRELSKPDVTKDYVYRTYNAESGEYLWVRAGAHSVARRDQAVYIYISYTDITDTKKAEGLRIELEAAKAAGEAKSRFLSRMSHEIRTPINAIMGIAELERQDVEAGSVCTENIAKYSRDTFAASQYLLTLVNDVLDTARIENNQMEIRQQPVEAESFLENIRVLVAPLAREKNITLTLQRKTHTHDTYIGDGVRVKQILVNLVNNAVKFTPPGGHVCLTSEAVADTGEAVTLRFTVSDDGIGMSEAFQKKLFTPFAQENGGNTSPFSGTGLGLSIARALARKMGGDITCESKAGEGTTFTVTITVGIGESATAQGSAAVPEREATDEKLDLAGVRVLVCEDHPLNQKITKALLERRHCTVDIAEDGTVGVERFEHSAPGAYTLILMDIRMPNMDGLQATEAIRALPRPDAKTIPIVAMSANAYGEDVQRSLDAGMNAHLAKPVDAAALYRTVAQFAGKQQK